MSQGSVPLNTGKRRFQTCLIGCLGSVVLLAVLFAGGYYWMATPGPQTPTDQFAGSDSLALIHVEGLRDDPGLALFLENLIEQVQNIQTRQLENQDIPWFVRFLAGGNRDVTQDQMDDALSDVPKDLTITLETLDESDPNWVVAVNLARFPRLIRTGFWLSSLFTETRDFNGYPLIKFDQKSGFTATFVDHTLLWAETEESLKHVLKRYLSQTEWGESGLLESYTIRDPRWSIYGVVANRSGALAWITQKALVRWVKQADTINRQVLEAELSGIEYMQFGVDVLDESTVELQIHFDCYSNQEARELREKIKLGEYLVQPMWQSEGIELSLEHRVAGNTMTVEAKINNLIDFITRKIEQAEEQGENR